MSLVLLGSYRPTVMPDMLRGQAGTEHGGNPTITPIDEQAVSQAYVIVKDIQDRRYPVATKASCLHFGCDI